MSIGGGGTRVYGGVTGGGTVTLTGDAVEADVASGKTFYSNSTVQKTGSLVNTPNYAPTVSVGTVVADI